MEKEGWGESAAKPGGETVRRGGELKGGRERVGEGRGGCCRDRSASVKDRTPKQVSVRQTVRQTEYIKSGGAGGGRAVATRPAGRPAGVTCTSVRQRQGQRTQSATTHHFGFPPFAAAAAAAAGDVGVGISNCVQVHHQKEVIHHLNSQRGAS